MHYFVTIVSLSVYSEKLSCLYLLTLSHEVAKCCRCSIIPFSPHKKIKVLVAHNPIYCPPPIHSEFAVIALGSSGKAILKIYPYYCDCMRFS